MRKVDRRQKPGRLAGLCGLLERVSQSDQRAFSERPAHEADAYRQSKYVAGRDGNAWAPGCGAEDRRAACAVVAVDDVREVSGAVGQRDQCVEAVSVECGVQAFLAREPSGQVMGLLIGGTVQAAVLLHLEQYLLAEERHLPVAISVRFTLFARFLSHPNRRGHPIARDVVHSSWPEEVRV
jgi:hypothetical protein